MKWIVSLVASLVILAGCATGYGKAGLFGGYDDTQLDENVFSITFKGNAYTNMQRASDFTYLRAADLTLQNGYTYFAVTFASKNVSTTTYATASQTTTEINFYGNTAYATSQTTPGQTYTQKRPVIEMTIICFKEKPQTDATLFTAKFLSASIKKKYGMDQQEAQ